MNISYFDDARVTEAQLKKKQKQLTEYRQLTATAHTQNNTLVPEYSLYYPNDGELHDALAVAQKRAKGLKYVLLVGIGGQSLGVEAVHEMLKSDGAELLVLDTVSVSQLHEIYKKLASCKKVSQLAICVSSKSGTTTEVLANASTVFTELESRFGKALYDQTYFIGTAGTAFMKYGKKQGATCIGMPEVIGGRFSVGTAAGLVPLALLGHDVDEFISGYIDTTSPILESVVAESAARLVMYHQLKFPHYNFFAFETRLLKLGYWYRQLFAESLGKEKTVQGKAVPFVMVPTVITPVELHSVGQLYMSGVPNVYTDFVSFDDDILDILLPKKNTLAPALKGLSLQEVATAIYGGVIAAYQERQLPYRATIFEENLAYSVGQFMALRIREVMYAAKLLDLNAFDQPNVELYKQKTKEILGI